MGNGGPFKTDQMNNKTDQGTPQEKRIRDLSSSAKKKFETSKPQDKAEGKKPGDKTRDTSKLSDDSSQKKALDTKEGRSLGELKDKLSDQQVTEGTPKWLTPNKHKIDIGGGKNAELTNKQSTDALKKIETLNDMPYRDLIGRKPEGIGDIAIITNPDSGKATWMPNQDIPKGPQVINGNWIHKDEKGGVRGVQRYPEDKQAIEATLRKKGIESNDRTVSDIQKANRKLNNKVDEYLKKGESLESAINKMKKDAGDEFKKSLWDLSNMLWSQDPSIIIN